MKYGKEAEEQAKRIWMELDQINADAVIAEEVVRKLEKCQGNRAIGLMIKGLSARIKKAQNMAFVMYGDKKKEEA